MKECKMYVGRRSQDLLGTMVVRSANPPYACLIPFYSTLLFYNWMYLQYCTVPRKKIHDIFIYISDRWTRIRDQNSAITPGLWDNLKKLKTF